MTAPTLTDRQRQALWDLLSAEAGRPVDVPSPQVLARLRELGLAERASAAFDERHAHRATDAALAEAAAAASIHPSALAAEVIETWARGAQEPTP
jgi:hypothetical protein